MALVDTNRDKLPAMRLPLHYIYTYVFLGGARKPEMDLSPHPFP